MENRYFFDIQPRIAVYPCCESDIAEPTRIIKKAGLADQVIFCDKKKNFRSRAPGVQGAAWSNPKTKFFHNAVKQNLSLPCSFVQGDFRATLDELPIFDVFFYRRDSQREGGSGLWMFGDILFPRILGKMLGRRSYIISDGSNDQHNIFKEIQAPGGFKIYGRHFQLHKQQLPEYPQLKIITVDWDM